MLPAKSTSLITEALYLVFFISLACSFRVVSSVTILLIFVTGLVTIRSKDKTILSKDISDFLLTGCLLLFLINVLALFYTGDKNEGWLNIQVKSGLVITPFAVCCTRFLNDITRKRLSFYFVCIITVVSLYCLGIAVWNYFQSGNFYFFFYHVLVQPVKGHAVYFSVLVFIALLLSLETHRINGFISNKALHVFFIFFLSVFLFLLSSKLVIGFYFLYLVVYFTELIKKRAVNLFLIIGLIIFLVAGSVIALTTANPLGKRFSDIMNGDLKVVAMDKYNPGMYFNGVQFRLLQWKFTGEILNEHHGWWTGVGPGNAQHFLDQKYISSNMYVGEPARGDHGFLGYNTHNQFLETILQTGIAGLIILLFTCVALLKMAFQKKKRKISFITGLLLTWLLTESVLERQYGILIFVFFPYFMWFDEK